MKYSSVRHSFVTEYSIWYVSIPYGGERKTSAGHFLLFSLRHTQASSVQEESKNWFVLRTLSNNIFVSDSALFQESSIHFKALIFLLENIPSPDITPNPTLIDQVRRRNKDRGFFFLQFPRCTHPFRPLLLLLLFLMTQFYSWC